MIKIEVDFSNQEKGNLELGFIQNGFTEGVLTLKDNINNIELHLSREQLEQLKEFLKDKEINVK